MSDRAPSSGTWATGDLSPTAVWPCRSVFCMRRGPFCVRPLNPAQPGELLESELFGHERGAFTGAYRDKPGKFELAQSGTILLDEIGEVPLRLQAKLLHILQDGEFARVGGERILQTDVRVLAATNRDLEVEIRAGRFREDLYYRLNVIAVQIPPLRERRDEIPALIDALLAAANAQYG